KRCTLGYLLAKPYSETKSCQMARAFRPRLSPKSMASRYGSQALGLVTSSESVITSLTGFEVALAVPLVERVSGSGLGLALGVRLVLMLGLGLTLRWGSRGSGITGMAGFAAPESVITSLAGFGARRHQPLGGRTAIPAAFRWAL